MKIDKIEIITYYSKDDKEFVHDYTRKVIKINGKIAQEYGDNYHDGGRDKVIGFMDGLQFVYGDLESLIAIENKNEKK